MQPITDFELSTVYAVADDDTYNGHTGHYCGDGQPADYPAELPGDKLMRQISDLFFAICEASDQGRLPAVNSDKYQLLTVIVRAAASCNGHLNNDINLWSLITNNQIGA